MQWHPLVSSCKKTKHGEGLGDGCRMGVLLGRGWSREGALRMLHKQRHRWAGGRVRQRSRQRGGEPWRRQSWGWSGGCGGGQRGGPRRPVPPGVLSESRSWVRSLVPCVLRSQWSAPCIIDRITLAALRTPARWPESVCRLSRPQQALALAWPGRWFPGSSQGGMK